MLFKLGLNFLAVWSVALVLCGTAFAQSGLLPPPIPSVSSPSGTQVPTIEYLQEEALKSSFKKARRQFQPVTSDTPSDIDFEVKNQPSVPNTASQFENTNQIQPIISEPYIGHTGGKTPLERVQIRVAYEDLTIQEVMERVAGIVGQQSGEWMIKWRLKDENKSLVDQRVSLNAESDFDAFLSHLIDKINNLTGVRLFVKVFEVSRVIVIADSF